MQLREIWQCDFCNKRLIGKDAMEGHETQCANNPKNKTLCTDCHYMESDPIEISETRIKDLSDMGLGLVEQEITYTDPKFICSKLGLKLYTYNAKRKKLIEKYPDSFKGKVLMPAECKDFTGMHSLITKERETK